MPANRKNTAAVPAPAKTLEVQLWNAADNCRGDRVQPWNAALIPPSAID